jgi:hypothetical protein
VCLGFFLLLSVVGLVSLYTFAERFEDAPTAGGNIVDTRHAAKPKTAAYRKPVE